MPDDTRSRRETYFPELQTLIFNLLVISYPISAIILSQLPLPSSQTYSSTDGQAGPVTASDSSDTLEMPFTLAYAHLGMPSPDLRLFPTIQHLWRTAEKYQMHRVLQYLSSLLI